MTIDEIAAFLVVTFPELMKGWKTGTEYDRRLQIHGLVNTWTSIWAPQFVDERVIQKEDAEKEVVKSKGRKEKNKLEVPKWMKEEAVGKKAAGDGPLIEF